MKIGIIGTRGIPNHYGGFEQFAENFSVRMAEKGHDVTVYTSHRHPFKSNLYKGVRLAHCYDPEHVIGTAGQFIYDFNCIRHARGQKFDIILQLGYTSSTVWSWMFPKSSLVVTNMDGLEWSRAKYNKPTQYFLTHAERWGVRYSNYLIADSKGIQEYLRNKYNAPAILIPYGAEIYDPSGESEQILEQYALKDNQYDLLIARFEPENNIETVLRAYSTLRNERLVLVGNYNNTRFGRNMFKEYGVHEHISFIGANYDGAQLNALRHHSRLYLHGHSVGGTNPSLLEAMACNAMICAHNNQFNRHVLGDDAFYFNTSKDLAAVLATSLSKQSCDSWLCNNKQKIATYYNWDEITKNIETYFKQWKFGEQYLHVHYAV